MKKFTLKQLFSIVDGRLSTTIGDVYEILNHVCDFDLYTHQLPTAMYFIKQLPILPEWFIKSEKEISSAKSIVGNDFNKLMDYIDAHNTDYNIPQLSDLDLSNFGEYLIENSLLKTLGKKAN